MGTIKPKRIGISNNGIDRIVLTLNKTKSIHPFLFRFLNITELTIDNLKTIKNKVFHQEFKGKEADIIFTSDRIILIIRTSKIKETLKIIESLTE